MAKIGPNWMGDAYAIFTITAKVANETYIQHMRAEREHVCAFPV